MIPSISFSKACLLAVLTVSAVACGPKNYLFEGEWRGEKTVPAAPGANPDVINSLREVKVIVKGNDRFDLLVDGYALSGGISVSGNDATLHVDAIANQPWERNPANKGKEPPEFELAAIPGGDARFSNPKNPQDQAVTLHRIATGHGNRP